MTDEIDHLREYEAFAALSTSTNYCDIDIKEAGAIQRGEKQATPRPIPRIKRKFTAEQTRDMIDSTDSLAVVAKRNGTTKQMVANVKAAARLKPRDT